MSTPSTLMLRDDDASPLSVADQKLLLPISGKGDSGKKRTEYSNISVDSILQDLSPLDQKCLSPQGHAARHCVENGGNKQHKGRDPMEGALAGIKEKSYVHIRSKERKGNEFVKATKDSADVSSDALCAASKNPTIDKPKASSKASSTPKEPRGTSSIRKAKIIPDSGKSGAIANARASRKTVSETDVSEKRRCDPSEPLTKSVLRTSSTPMRESSQPLLNHKSPSLRSSSAPTMETIGVGFSSEGVAPKVQTASSSKARATSPRRATSGPKPSKCSGARGKEVIGEPEKRTASPRRATAPPGTKDTRTLKKNKMDAPVSSSLAVKDAPERYNGLGTALKGVLAFATIETALTASLGDSCRSEISQRIHDELDESQCNKEHSRDPTKAKSPKPLNKSRRRAESASSLKPNGGKTLRVPKTRNQGGTSAKPPKKDKAKAKSKTFKPIPSEQEPMFSSQRNLENRVVGTNAAANYEENALGKVRPPLQKSLSQRGSDVIHKRQLRRSSSASELSRELITLGLRSPEKDRGLSVTFHVDHSDKEISASSPEQSGPVQRKGVIEQSGMASLPCSSGRRRRLGLSGSSHHGQAGRGRIGRTSAAARRTSRRLGSSVSNHRVDDLPDLLSHPKEMEQTSPRLKGTRSGGSNRSSGAPTAEQPERHGFRELTPQTAPKQNTVRGGGYKRFDALSVPSPRQSRLSGQSNHSGRHAAMTMSMAFVEEGEGKNNDIPSGSTSYVRAIAVANAQMSSPVPETTRAPRSHLSALDLREKLGRIDGHATENPANVVESSNMCVGVTGGPKVFVVPFAEAIPKELLDLKKKKEKQTIKHQSFSDLCYDHRCSDLYDDEKLICLEDA